MRCLILLLCFFSLIYSSYSLAGGDGRFEIRFVKTISSSRDVDQDSSVSKMIVEFLFGDSHLYLSKPISLITGHDSELWILDQGVGNIAYLNSKENVYEYLDKNDESTIMSPVGICRISDQYILFTDSYLGKIYQLDLKNDSYSALNDTLSLNHPTGIVYLAATNEIWVSETAAHRLLVLDVQGNLIRTIGERGSEPGEFNFPTYIWIDNAGIIYVVDSMNFRVQILNKDGSLYSVFGEIGDASGYFARPKGIATDSRGHIYVVDALFHTVQIFDRKGNFLSYFGGQGRKPGEFWLPAGIFIDDKDNIYIADSYNSRIQIFKLISGEKNEN